MKLTTRAIAAKAGVSAASVSRYYTGSETLSPDLVAKIEAAVTEMGGTLQPRRSQTRVILVLLSHLHFPFYSRALQSLMDRSIGDDRTFYILQYDPDHPEAVRSFVSKTRPTGVIYFEEEIDREVLGYLQSQGIRTVMCGGAAPDPGSDTIHVNDIRAAYDGTRYLLDLGHRQILFLSDDISKIGAGFQRITGCRKAMEEAGLPMPESHVRCGAVTFQAGYDEVEKALRQGIPFTAVFAFSDEMAVGAMAALFDAGIRVPAEVSVLGYDDLPIAVHVRPKLTTIHQPIDMFVRKALELFDRETSGLTEEILLPHSISQRDSCIRRPL